MRSLARVAGVAICALVLVSACCHDGRPPYYTYVYFRPGTAPAEAKATVPPQVAIPRPTNRTCASCGAALLAGDTFCRKCGVKVEQPATCAKCGSSLKADDTFCRACGTPVA